MKAGDLVRFRATHWLGGAGLKENQRPWLVGLLIEYHKREKMTTIMHEGKIIRIQARIVQKYGKRYFE